MTEPANAIKYRTNKGVVLNRWSDPAATSVGREENGPARNRKDSQGSCRVLRIFGWSREASQIEGRPGPYRLSVRAEKIGGVWQRAIRWLLSRRNMRRSARGRYESRGGLLQAISFSQITQDFVNHSRFLNTSDDFNRASTERAGFDINFEHAFQPLSPIHGSMAFTNRFFLRVGVVLSRLSTPSRCDHCTQCMIWRQHAVIPCEVDTRLGYKCGEPSNKVNGKRSKRFPSYRFHTHSWNVWLGRSGANISTRCRFGAPRTSNESWTRSRNITTVIGCIRGSRDKYPPRVLAAKTSQRFASMTTAGNLTVAAYFNYQWRLELEFAPLR